MTLSRPTASAICMLYLCLSLMVPAAGAATSLGSVTGARSMHALPGDTVDFDMLLFNIHDNRTLEVVIELEGPDGWDLQSSPANFNLDFHQPGKCYTKPGYECLNTGLGGIMARPVRITADVPYNADDGEYTIVASSSAFGSGSGLSTRP